MIKKLLLPLILLFFVTLSTNIVENASIIINPKSVLLVAFGMLLSAFIAVRFKNPQGPFHKPRGVYSAETRHE